MNLYNQGKAQTPIAAQISPSLATTTLTKPMPSPLPSLVGQLPSKQKGEQQKKGRSKIVVAVVTVVLLLLLLVVGFVLTRKSAPDVTLYKVSTNTVNNAIGGGGIIFPRQRLDISYPITERVISVLVKAGDRITTNQPLIQLDPTQLNIEVTQASNDLAAAQSYLNTVSVSGNALAIAQAQQQYNIAKNKYEALVAQTSSPTLHHGTLISPMNGVVTAIYVNSGEVFSANTSLITIMDESTVVVHVKIPLSDLGLVRVGQVAELIPSALPTLNFKGVVVSIVPQADPQTDTYEVWVEIPNKDMQLLPGMSAFVRIQADNKQAVAVPRLTVLNADHAPMVFVIRGTQAYLQPVHVIGRSVEVLYVDKGLKSGDRVVLVGNDRLHNGDSVHVVHVED